MSDIECTECGKSLEECMAGDASCGFAARASQRLYEAEQRDRARSSDSAGPIQGVKTMNNFENDVPVTADFWAGVRAEKEHQLKRWGTTNDRNKAPADWFWLVGYLGGKALAAAIKGDREKALHHCISTAAVLANWHEALSTDGPSLKVEHEPSQKLYVENPDPTRPSDLEKHLGEDARG